MPTANSRVIILLSVAALFGCQPSPTEQPPVSSSQPTVITSLNLSRITGLQWILKDMTVDGKEYPLTGEMPFIKFEIDGSVGGVASINRFFGPMTVDSRGKVDWPMPITATRMAGPPALMAQEDTFLKALPKTSSIAFEKIYLYMTSVDEKTRLTFYVPVE